MKQMLQIYFSVLPMIVGALFLSCSQSEKRYADFVEQWQGQEIILPETLSDVLSKDTLDFSGVDFTILTYIDSGGCTACNMRLHLWNEFFEALDTLQGSTEVSSLIVVKSGLSKELSSLMRRENYHYPVVNDTMGLFCSLDNLPDDVNLRTFLLDRNRKVVLIGNPVYNNAIADMYRAVISGAETVSDDGKKSVSVENPKIGLGKLSLGHEYRFQTSLYNRSADTVRIRDIIKSCNCIESVSSDSIIYPESRIAVTGAFYENQHTGKFTRSVDIFLRGFINPIKIEISGTVEP